jgi:hypothetical protein
MGLFQHNLNVYFPECSRDVAVKKVREGLLARLCAEGYRAVNEEESQTRSLLIVPHAGGDWITILDSGFEGGAEVQPELAKALQALLSKTVVGVSINDNVVNDFFFCHGKRELEEISGESHAPRIDSALHRFLRSLNRAPLIGEDLSPQRILEQVGLSVRSWQSLDDDFAPDRTDRGAVVRLAKPQAVVRQIRTAPVTVRIGDRRGLVIPQLLCGHPRDVRRRWRKVLKKLVKSKSWDEAFATEPFISIEDAPEILMLEEIYQGLGGPDDDDQVALYVVNDELCEVAADDGYAKLDLVRDLLLEEMHNFWACLTALADTVILPRMKPPSVDQAFARACLSRIMIWWEHLVQLEPRYTGMDWSTPPWDYSLRRVFQLAIKMGVPKDDILKAESESKESAGTTIRGWLA